MKRRNRHLLLAAISITSALGAGLMARTAENPVEPLDAISLVLSWLCLLQLAAALLVGPLQVLASGRPQLNHLLRRDLGIWCVINGLAHLFIAFRISMNPAYMQAFVAGASAWPGPVIRQQLYGWAVTGSLVIAALFVMLLALSSNRALRLLGQRWWKRLQRCSYLAFALTVAHAAAFQVIEGRNTWLVAVLALLTGTVVLAQAAAWFIVRRSARAG